MSSSLPIVEDQSDAIRFLGNADNWPWPNEGPLERIDTHGAIVFVGQQHVLKLKRAVRFDYMDFSTIERRRTFCDAEVTLNRRTAPDIYLEARPISRRSDGGLTFGGDSAAIDWVVVMRRFDGHQLFDRLAAEARLSIADAEGAALALAHLHRHAAVEARGGGADVMARTIRVNTEQLRRSGEGFVDRAKADALEAASLAALAAAAPLIERRRAEGFVRRVHGDAHLGNLCLIDAKPVLFDGIEFNDAFAVIDIGYDFAFLLMDLWHRGLYLHANGALNAWLGATNDYSMLSLLPLFISARAAIRAHVSASMSRVQEQAAPREALQAAANSYLSLAIQALEPRPCSLIGIGGLSGSGKSVLARQVAPMIGRLPGAVWLRSDVLRKELHGVAAEQALPQSAYRPEITRKVYGLMVERARLCLEAGHSVVLDAVHAKPTERDALRDLASAASARFVGLWLEAPEGLRVERANARVRDASDADGKVAVAQSKINAGSIDWVHIDATGLPDATFAAARQALADIIRPA